MKGDTGREVVDISKLRPKDQVRHLLAQHAGQIKQALPKHLSAERLMRVAQTAVTTTPGLLECYVPSLLGGIIQCAQLGLEPNTVMGHAYLIPFRNKKKNRTDVQVIVGYKGLIDLARRSGQIVSIAAHVVHENDHFEFLYGLEEQLAHRPADGDRGAITHFYAVAHMKGGGYAFEVMPRAQVDTIKASSQSRGKYGPWKDHYVEMGRKTAVRRLAKWLPLSVEMAVAVALDARAEHGDDQSLDGVLEGDFEIMSGEPQDDDGGAEETPAEPDEGGGDYSGGPEENGLERAEDGSIVQTEANVTLMVADLKTLGADDIDLVEDAIRDWAKNALKKRVTDAIADARRRIEDEGKAGADS